MSNLTPLEWVVQKATYLDRSGKTKAAVEVLTKGVQLCICQFRTTPPSLPPTSRSPTPRVRCTCRLFIPAACDETVLEVAKKPCTCLARKWKACQSLCHHQILSLLASLLAKLEHFEAALGAVEELLQLNPTHPEAYLRLAQILRLQKPGDANNAEQARKAYCTGLKVAKENPSPAFAAQYEALERMRDKMTCAMRHQKRRDPMAAFPPELIQFIFQNFSVGDLCQLTRVSKGWKARLTKDVQLWRHLCFASARRKRNVPGINAIKELCRRSHHTALSLRLGPSQWTLPGPNHQRFIQLLKLCPKLESLCLDDARSAREDNAIFFPLRLVHLTDVYFGPDFQVNRPLLRDLATCCGSCLRSLTIMQSGFVITRVAGLSSWIPDFPSLKHLRIGNDSSLPWIEQKNSALATRHLEQIVVHPEIVMHGPLPGNSDEQQPREACSNGEPAWPEMTVFKLYNTENWETADFPTFDGSKMVLLDAQIPIETYRCGFSNLKHYHFERANEASRADVWVSVLSSNTLEYLGVSVEVVTEDTLGAFHDAKVSTSSIRGLGLRIGHWELVTQERCDLFLQLLAECPNVESVTLDGLGHATPLKERMLLLVHRAAQMGAKQIYENVFRGTYRDEVHDFGRLNGVEVITLGKEHRMEIPIDLSRDWSVPFVHEVGSLR